MLKISDALAITMENRSDWLARRKRSIGSSDAAAVAGLCEYRTPIDVWQEKLGLAPDTPETEEMYWGKVHEEAILREYRKRTGSIVVEQLYFMHPQFDWITATVDGFRMDGRIVEIKTASAWSKDWGEEGTDQAPEPYIVQVHHQMLVTGATEADIVVLIGGNRYRVYPIARNEGLIEALLAREKAFHECLVRRVPPHWGRQDARSLATLNPGCEGEIEISDEVDRRVQMYEALSATAREIEVVRNELKVEILAALGNAKIGRLPDGRKVKRFLTTIPEHKVPERTVESYTKHYFTILKEKDKGDRSCRDSSPAAIGAMTEGPRSLMPPGSTT